MNATKSGYKNRNKRRKPTASNGTNGRPYRAKSSENGKPDTNGKPYRAKASENGKPGNSGKPFRAKASESGKPSSNGKPYRAKSSENGKSDNNGRPYRAKSSDNGKPGYKSGGKRWGGNRRNKNKKADKQELDLNKLVNKAVPVQETVYKPRHKFTELPLEGRLIQQLSKKGFQYPTEIQEKSMEWLIDGHNMLGIANTGTGKTGAFLIPVIHRLLTVGKNEQALVLVPTRELALQVEEEFKSMTKGLRLFATCIIGGTNIRRDMDRLKRFHHIIIGTPGRVIDLMNRRSLKLNTFSTLILDEFDRMLDMGFINDVNTITDAMENRKQTMLFSATENAKLKPLINQLLHQPKEVRVTTGTTSADHIEQDVVRIGEGENKLDTLLNMIAQEEFKKVLIFAETKRWTEKLAQKLNKAGVKAEEIHGNKTQGYRKKALDRFRFGKVKVLVATDVAARGIDVDDITHVINYDIPQNMESYVHRIGRTGRAGKAGKAFTLVG